MRLTFCAVCGTRIYHVPGYRDGVFSLKPGTLDERGGLEPTLHVWTRSKQPWVQIPPGVKTFDEEPF